MAEFVVRLHTDDGKTDELFRQPVGTEGIQVALESALATWSARVSHVTDVSDGSDSAG